MHSANVDAAPVDVLLRNSDEWAEESSEEDPCEDFACGLLQRFRHEPASASALAPTHVVNLPSVGRALCLPRPPPACLRG